jgi:hypothetical protein
VFSKGRAARSSVLSAVKDGLEGDAVLLRDAHGAGLGVEETFPNACFYFTSGVNLWALEMVSEFAG